jgi:alpha-tubulin suppressor-like RCC1 family protein
MAEVTTNFRDSNNGDLGKNLVSREYLQSVYPKLSNSLYRGNLVGNLSGYLSLPQWTAENVPNNWRFVQRSAYAAGIIRSIVAINQNGSAWTTGDIPGSTGFRSSFVVVGGKNDKWKSIHISQTNIVGIKTEGTLWVSGDDSNGQFGAWTTVSGVRLEYTSSTNWKTVCAGPANCFGIKEDGSLWTWGSNANYALGRDGAIPFMDIPAASNSTSLISRDFTSSTNWKKITVSAAAFALKSDGSLWTWGRNVGLTNNPVYQYLSTPSQMIFGNSNFKTLPATWTPSDIPSISHGTTGLSIKNDGSLWAWGDNRMGLFGTNNYNNVSPHSMRREISSSTNWKQIDVNSATTQSMALGLKTDGTLWRWGANYGNYPPGGRNIYASPIQLANYGLTTWSTFSCATYSGSYNSKVAAIRSTDNTLWFWGGSLIIGGFPASAYNNPTASPIQEKSFSADWSSVSFGFDHLSAIKTNGTLWTIGGNDYGQVGNNISSTSTGSSLPIQEFTSSTNWKQVSTSTYYTLALKTNGTLWGWGNNLWGQLGVNDTISRSTPVQEWSSSTNWKFVAAGAGSGFAIKNDGTLWSWGNNSVGQLGVNDAIGRYTPVQEFTSSANWNYILRPVSAIGGGTVVADISVMAVKDDGTLWGWGNNNLSQLGIESGVYLITPVREYTNSQWIDFHVMDSSSTSFIIISGIKKNGTLWEKKCHYNMSLNYSSPLRMLGQGKSWKSCSSGEYYVTALATDGTVYRTPSILNGSSGRFISLSRGSDPFYGADAIEFET